MPRKKDLSITQPQWVFMQKLSWGSQLCANQRFQICGPRTKRKRIEVKHTWESIGHCHQPVIDCVHVRWAGAEWRKCCRGEETRTHRMRTTDLVISIH
jgi:hypothetical protein